MIATVLFGILAFVFLALLLARYGTNPKLLGAPPLYGRGPRITPERFRELTTELLAKMGVEAVPIYGDDLRLAGRKPDPFRDTQYVIVLEPAPTADVVEATSVLDLASSVRVQSAAVGLLMTPYAIDRTGLNGFDVEIELIDGERLRELFAEFVPDRLPEIDRYRGFGKKVTVPSPALTPRRA